VNDQGVNSCGSRKKVAHLTTVHSPFDVRIFHKECKTIARAGYDATLIACHDRDETRDSVRIRAVPKPSGRLARMIRGVSNVYREAVRLDADLYHFHDPELLPAGLLLRLRGKKVIYDVHEDVSADIAVKQYIPKALQRVSAGIVSLLETLSATSFSAIVAATPTIAERFASKDQLHVVVKNYPILEEFCISNAAAWPCKSMAVAYVGVMARNRCIEEVTQAMALLPASLGATLKLVGSISPPSFAEELRTVKGWEHTESLGVLDRAGVARVLADVRAGLVVLKPTPAFLASIPIKMFEYMCAGIPVIASNFPGFAEVVDGAKCGLLVDPGDPRAIAQAIEFVLTHPDEAKEMGRRGREAVVTKYNWANEGCKLIQLYGTLLDPPCAA